MNVFHCPVCEEKIGFFQKLLQSTQGNGLVECPACKNKLRLKKYGSSVATAGLVDTISIWILGFNERNWILHVALWIIILLGYKILSPLVLYKPKKTWLPEWAITALGLFVLIFYIIVAIFL